MLRDTKDQEAERKQESAAAAMYQEAIKKDPKFVQAYNNQGMLFFQQNKYPQAIEQYQRANDIDPRFANHKWWGRTLIADKQYDEAIAQCQKAVELDRKAVNGYNCWGDALVAEKKYDEAIEQYKKTIEIDPKTQKLMKAGATLSVSKGNEKRLKRSLPKPASVTDDGHCEASKARCAFCLAAGESTMRSRNWMWLGAILV
jgi:tetratricopeptide (TPR) repeat protein